MLLEDVILRGTRAGQPAATTVPTGTLYCVTDESDIVERSNGTTWDAYSPAGGGSGTVTNTGTLTANALILGNGTVDVTAAASLGTTTTVLHGNAAGAPTFAAVSLTADVSGTLPVGNLPTSVKTRTVGITIDGGGSAITTGVKGYIQCPISGTITANTVLADQSGSIVIDVWKDTYANYPPTVADTITASAKPTLSSAIKSTDSTLTGWTTSVTAGDCFGFNVDSATTVTRVTLMLTVAGS